MTALKNNYLATDLKIVIYSPFNRSTEILFGHEVHYLNSNQFDRWDAFKMFPESWLCFLDADCNLDENLVLNIRKELQSLNGSTVLCGRYETKAGSSKLAHSYNSLCNTWLEAGLLVSEPRVLGGLFVIYSSQKLRSVEFEKFPKWGAEDYRMARHLGKNDFNFKLSDSLFTLHQPNNYLFWFFKRAWIHGSHRPENVRTNTTHWLKMLIRQNVVTVIYILIHFGTGCISKSVGKTRKRAESLNGLLGSFIKTPKEIKE